MLCCSPTWGAVLNHHWACPVHAFPTSATTLACHSHSGSSSSPVRISSSAIRTAAPEHLPAIAISQNAILQLLVGVCLPGLPTADYTTVAAANPGTDHRNLCCLDRRLVRDPLQALHRTGRIIDQTIAQSNSAAEGRRSTAQHGRQHTAPPSPSRPP